MLTNKEINDLRSSRTEKEWNAVCAKLKAKHNGKYPSDWHEKIILSGILNRSIERWKKNKKNPLNEKFKFIFGCLVCLTLLLIVLLAIILKPQPKTICVQMNNGLLVCRPQ